MLENLVNAVGEQIATFISTVASLLKVIIKSRFSVKIPAPQRAVCAILGNGPSLRQSLENDLDFIRNAELYCVNNFASSPEYALLQPMNYALLDPAFFCIANRTIAEKTSKKPSAVWST